ncbi:hypothetical protein D6783_03380 [Candidatus Woesearchaeota archaeon]|nr:MAG: hypothetical protein D6783_03380 [Candidatus Woesearchaeota archaeon]
MKVMITFFGVVTLLAGVVPFILGFLPEQYRMFLQGYFYIGLVVVIGLGGIGYAFSQGLFGMAKGLMFLYSVLVIIGGLLPLLGRFVSLPFPVEGVVQAGIIILLGVVGTVWGLKAYM